MENQKPNAQLLDSLKQQLDQLQTICNQVAQAQDAQRLQLIQLAGVVQQTQMILQQIAITELRGQGATQYPWPQAQQAPWGQMFGYPPPQQQAFPQVQGFPQAQAFPQLYQQPATDPNFITRVVHQVVQTLRQQPQVS